jgi:pectate lyase
MSIYRTIVVGLLAASTCSLAHSVSADSTSLMATVQLPAGGWAKTFGGKGGHLIRVTTLAADGPGSLKEAIGASGPRIVVFEVGGQIDLGELTLNVTEPYLTIAGQTAPSPGITLVHGKGVAITTHDVIVQHVRIRTGDSGHAKASGWSTDGIRTEDGAYDVIIDHCSLTWATNKIAAVSGSRFKGRTPEEWRNSTSHRVTLSNNIIAEALSHSSHWKIEHSKGALIHDNTTGVLIIANLFAHNYERSPLFKGGVQGAIINNLIFDPGQRAIHYNLIAEEWGSNPYQVGKMTAVGNVMRAGMSTPPDVAFLEIGGDGDLDYYGNDNIAVDRIGRPLPMEGSYTTTGAKINELASPPVWPAGISPIPAKDVQRVVLAGVGARPWDRDYHDARLVADVAEGRGWIIDSEADVHGNLPQTPTHRVFNPAQWNLDTMMPRSPDALSSDAKSRTLMVPEGN